MSVNIYARQAPISDACGRADYISNANRQENLMATATTVSAPDFWQRLSADGQAAFRQAGGCKTKEDGTAMKACEAREIHVQLPNSALNTLAADLLAQKLANEFKAKYGVDCLVAIHYNKTKSNLHCHILFSERQLLQAPEVKIADRNVFLDANGIRTRTKKEILDIDGQLLPGCSIVKKGEVLSARYFGDKNAEFSKKAWMNEYRHYMAGWINENLQPDELRTVFDKDGPYLAQKHLGAMKDNELLAAKRRGVEAWNILVKQFNRLVDDGYITREEALDFKTRIGLSPDQNQELKAVLGEVCREIRPDSSNRPAWDRYAAQAASAPLSDDVANRQEKQDLRELYKEHGEARIAVIDAGGGLEEALQKIAAEKVAGKIAQKKTELGMTPEMKKVRELGRLSGVKNEEIDLMYQAAPRMTGTQWKQVWTDCQKAKAQFWESYREQRDQLQGDLDEAYRRRRKVRAAEWALDPRNRKAGLLGVIYAAIVLARNGSLEKWNTEIGRLKREQASLRQEVRRFKTATSDTHDVLHTKGLEPDAYLASVLQLQQMANRVERLQMQSYEQQRW